MAERAKERRVGKYIIGRTLGKGSFSKVKDGTDTETGEKVAIKVIDKARMSKEEMQEQIKREISITKLLRHENVVTLKHVFQTPKYIYLVMELVTGGDFVAVLQRSTFFKEEVAREYFQQLILGVSYCHNQGIAHRDLKPENLLLDSNNKIKISDFGLSNLQSFGAEGGDNLLTTVCGTPNYVAPEVLTNGSRGYNGIAADIWSCGVILYVLMTGMLPFDHPDVNVLFKMIEMEDCKMPAYVSKGAADMLAMLLRKNPLERATMEEIVSHPWFLDGFDVERLKSTTKPAVVPDNANTDEMESVDDGLDFDTSYTVNSNSRSVLAMTGGAEEGRSPSSSSGDRVLMGSLLVDHPVAATVRLVTDVLSQLDAHPKAKEGMNEVRGFIQTRRTGLLAYSALCLATACNSTLIEVKRMRGDSSEFDDFFFAFKQAVEVNARMLPVQ